MIGGEITQSNDAGTAKGYIASYDKETDVLKYYQDRSLYFGNTLIRLTIRISPMLSNL